MQNPSSSDPRFKELLDKLQEQNQRGYLTQLLQLKADREIAGEDGDKRESQLDEAISSLKDLKIAVTGIDLNVDITPLVNIGENQTRLLEELSRESALTRKLTEGSVEYDKAAAQYRNTSGREIESAVTGKVSKKGGFLDFETARTATAGQSARAQEANQLKLKPIDYVPGKSVATITNNSTTTSNTSTNNVETKEEKNFFKSFGDEIVSGVKYFMTDGLSERSGKKDKESRVSSPRQSTVGLKTDAGNNSTDLVISKELLDATRAQLLELKTIREALAPSTPRELTEQRSAPSSTNEKEESSGGSVLGDIAGKILNKDTVGKTPGKPGKAASTGSKVLSGLGKVARVLGPAAVVAGAAYTGAQGYQNTGENFDIEEGKEATVGQKTASALGGVASGLTFGLVNEKAAAQGVYRAGEAVSGAASKAKNFLGEKISGVGSSISSFFKPGNQVQGTSISEAATARSNYAAVDPRRTDMAGRTVSNTSIENADMSRSTDTGSSGGNTIVSNNVNNTSTTKYVPMKASPRPEYTGSALDRYQSRIAVF